MTSALPKTLPRGKRAAFTRSQVMARIRSQDTKPEIATRSAVHALGQRYRKHVASLPGKPDLANQKKRWAIFVHGCFWHSHEACSLASDPKSNRDYWTEKLRRNQARDREKLEALLDMGFKVLIVWECDVRKGKRLQADLKRFFRGM
jgi:DNA mismatch endonuclease (patch repair protein)